MRGILLLNGDPHSGEIDGRGAFVVCCDGAYSWAKGRVPIDMNIGDYDSLNIVPDPPPEEVFPSEKDFTDGEIGLNKLLERGVDEIEIYGGGGGREDHFLGNLQLLYLAHAKKVACKMICNRSVIFAATGKIELGEYSGLTISVLPFGDKLHIIDFRGLKYSYPPMLSLGECRGISNIVESSSAYLRVEGVALVVVNKGEV